MSPLQRLLRRWRKPRAQRCGLALDERNVPLVLERLEERRVLSVTAMIDAGGDLVVTGDGAGDDVSIDVQTDMMGNESITVMANGVVVPIEVSSGVFQNSVDTDDVTGGDLFVDLGAGNDTLSLELPTGLNVTADTGDGDDSLSIDPASVASGDFVHVTAESVDFGSGGTVSWMDVDLTVDGTLHVDQNLSLNTGGGDVMLNGDLVSSTEANFSVDTMGGSFTITGGLGLAGQEVGTVAIDTATGVTTLGDVEATGSLTLTGGQIDLGGDLTADSFDVDGNVHLQSSTSFTSTGDLDLSGSTIVADGAGFNLTLDAGGDITLGNVNAHDPGTGTVMVNNLQVVDAVDVTLGEVTIAGSLTQTTGTGITQFGGEVDAAGININTADIEVLADLTTGSGGVTLTGDGSTTLIAADITTSGGAIVLNDDLLISGARTLSTTGGGSPGAAITLMQDVDGANAGGTDTLTLTAGTGDITTSGNIGSGTVTGGENLEGFTASGAVVRVNNLTVVNSIDITGTQVRLQGSTYRAQTGDIQFTGPVILDTNVFAMTAGNDVIFSSTVQSASGNNDLTVSAGADAIFMGAVSQLRNLNVNATDMTEFQSTVTLSGSLQTDTAVSLGTTVIHDTITTTGDQRYGDAVIIASDVTLTGNDITFTSTVDSDSGQMRQLTVNSTGGGVTTFTGDVGSTDQLSALITNADGRTVIGGDIHVNGATATTFNDAVVLSDDVLIDQDGTGNVQFSSTVDSAAGDNFGLTVDTTTGATIFSAAVGSGGLTGTEATGLGSLETDADGTTQINGGLVRTTGTQTYNDAVTLNAASNSTTLTASEVVFNDTLRGASDAQESLTIQGDAEFNGNVGDNSQRLVNLTVTGTADLGAVSITTSGQQSYQDVVLSGNAMLTGVDNDADGEGVEIGGTITGAGNDLQISGGAQLVGAASGLGSFAADRLDAEATLSAQSVTVTGDSELGDNVTALGGSISLGTTTADDVVLTGNVQLTASDQVLVSGGISGMHNLAFSTTNGADVAEAIGNNIVNLTLVAGTLTAASVSITGNLETNDTLATDVGGVTVGGTSSLGGDVNTVGEQRYVGAVTLTDDVTLTASDTTADDRAIEFVSTVDDDGMGGTASRLTISTADDVRFGGAVGATSAIDGITVNTADDVLFVSTLQTTGDVIQSAGTGTTTLNGTSGAGIGGALSLATNSIVLSGAQVTTTGAVSLTAQNAISIAAGSGLNAGASTVSIAANQDGLGSEGFTQASGTILSTTNETANAVQIQVGGTGDAAIADVRAGTTSGVVTISAGGAIVDNTAGSEAANVTSFAAALTASSGIGAGSAASDIDTRVSQIAFMNTGGATQIENDGALTIASVGALASSQASGGGFVTANSPLTIAADVMVGGNMTFTAGDSAAVDDDLTVAANVTHVDGNGTIAFVAGDDVILQSGTIQNTGGAVNAVTITADNEGAADADRGGVTQSGGTIVAGSVAVRSFDSVSLTQAGNDFDTFAAQVTGSGATLTVTDTDGLTIGTVDGVAGLTTNSGKITLSTGQQLVIGDGSGQSIDAGSADVRLNVTAGGATTQAGSIITAGGLALSGAGAFTLNNANDVDTFAADVLGSVSFNDSDELTIGVVDGIAGIATGDPGDGGDIFVETDGNLTIEQAVTTETGTGGMTTITAAIINSGSITAGAGDITLIGGGPDLIVNTDQTFSSTTTLTASRDIIINATVETTGASSDLFLIADSDNDSVGGVLINVSGAVIGSNDVTIAGADLFATAGSIDSVLIMADGANDQVLANGDLLIQSTAMSPAGADIIIDGRIHSQTGNIEVNAADETRLGTTVTADMGNVTFRDAVVVTGQTTVVATSGNVTFDSTIDDDGFATSSALTVTAGGTTRFSGAVGSTQAIDQLTTDGGGLTEIDADIHVAAGPVTFNDNVLLTSDVAISAMGAGGIVFGGTVNSEASETNTLSASAANGPITFAGAVGNNVNGELGGLTVTSAQQLSLQDTVEVAGNIDITAGVVNVDQMVTTTMGGSVEITNGGLLTLGNSASFVLDGSFTQNGSGAVTSGADVSTTGDAISWSSGITLTDDVLITSGAGGGNISFDTVDGNFLLNVAAGTGQVTFADSLGSTTALSGVQVTSAGSVGFLGSVAVDDQGLAVTATGGVQFADDVTSTTGGGVTITNGGTLQIANGADFQLDGSFTQNGAGNVVTGGDITTTGDNVSFASSVRLTDSIAIDTTNGGAVVGGADITFSRTVDATGSGVQGLTINAGTMGDAIFTGAVGGTTRLGGVVITQANDVEFQSTVSAASILQQAGTGTTTFQGAVNTNTASGISLTGTSFTFNGPVTTTSAGGVTIVHTGLLDIAPAADFMLDGAFLQTGTGQVQLAGDITTTGDMILFQGPVTLTDGGTVALNTTAGGQATGADVTFQGTLNSSTAGAENLLIDAGTMGDVQFAGTVGATARLADVTIQNANDVLVAQAFTADSLTQLAGTGTTTTDGLVTLHEVAGLNLMADRIVINGGVDVRTAGNNGAIALQAGSEVVINSTLLSGGGSVSIASNDDVRFTGTGQVDSTAGNVTVTADADGDANGMGGALLMADGAQVLAGSGTVSLSADENIVLGQVATTNNGANAVTIVSSSGGVVDGGDADVDIVAATGQVTISASTGIGSGDALETTVARVDLTNTTSGGIGLVETDALSIEGITQGAGSDVQVQTTNGSITVVDGMGSPTITSSSTGSVTLDANGAASDLDVEGGITTASGSVQLSADRNVNLAATGDVTSTSGDVTVTADADGLGGGALTMADGAVIDAGSGRISLSATNDITVGGLQTTSSADDAVTIVSSSGGVVDGGDADVDIVAATGQVTISASTGIGSGDALETTVARVDLTNTTSGGIGLVETDALSIRNIDQSAAGQVRVETFDGTITVTDGDQGIMTEAGGLQLIAGGATSDILVHEDITTHGGDVALTAGRNVASTVGDDITTTSAANSGIASGNVTIAAQGTGSIQLAGDVVTTGATGGASGGDVMLSTVDGSIQLTGVDVSGGANAGGMGGAAGTVTAVAGDANTSNDSNIVLTGAITALGGAGASAGADGTVTMSAGGAILDGNDGSTLISTGDLSLTAVASIGTIDDFSTQTGDAIDVMVSGELTRLATTGDESEINLNVMGDLVAASGAIEPGVGVDGDLLIQTSGNLDVGTAVGALVLTSGDDVGLHAQGTLVIPDAGIDVGTGQLALTGGVDVVDPSGRDLGQLVASNLVFVSGSQGGDTTLLTNVDTLTADLSTSPAGTTLTVVEEDSIELVRVSTNSGDIEVRAATMAAGDIVVDQIDAGTAMVSLDTTTMGGAILDGSDAETDIVAGTAVLRATTGIGSTGPLEIDVNTLAATTVAGDLRVCDVAGGLVIGTVDGLVGVSITSGSVGDDIEISALGPLTVDTNVTNIGGGAITLASEGTTTDRDLTINGSVTTSGGDGAINLFAGDSVIVAATGLVHASNAGEVTILAGTNFNKGGSSENGTATGSVQMASGAVVGSDDGNVVVRAPGDVEVALINADLDGDGTRGNITVQADFDGVEGGLSDGDGAIRDALAGEAANLVGAQATLLAASGIGATDDIDSDLDTVSITNTTDGNVVVTEIAGMGDNDLTVLNATNMQDDIDIRTTDGQLTVTGPVSTTGAGAITLVAGDSDNDGNGDLLVNGAITGENGTVSLQSVGNDVRFSAAGDVTTTSGQIDVTAGSMTQDGEIFQEDGSVLDAGDDRITLTAFGNVTLGQVKTLSTADDAVTISTTRGVIDGGDSGGADIDVSQGRVVIQAVEGVGDTNAIETQAGSIDLTNTTSGDVQINETDDVTIFGIDQAGPGDVTVTSGGTQTVSSDGTGITAASGNILLDANGVESSIVIESTVQTTVGMVQLQADQDIVLTSTGIVQTTSGNIDLEADTDATRDGMGGAITMADGSQILSDSGMIRLLADSDITVGRIVTSTQISIESVSRGIVDAGDTGGVDLQAEDLALRAATGIGSDNAIETSVSQLAAFNQIAGNIRIDNSSGSLLTIGVVDGLSGVTQGGTAGGWIEVNHIGALTVDAPVVNVSGGGIVLTAASNGGGDDDLTINDVVMAPGENGDILFLVDDGLYINDSGSELDVYGKSVTGHAGGEVIFSDDVIVASFTGSITQPTPEITSVTTPQVTATGIAVVETEFGREDESNFTFVFVWDPEEGVFDELSSGDVIVSDDTGGVIGVVPTDAPDSVTVDHFYDANPNEENPSADIPITVILFDDPNITFTSAGVDLGVTMVTSLASVPGEGLVGFAVFDLSIEVPPIEAPRISFSEAAEDESASTIDVGTTVELQSVADFEAVSSERVVIIERIGPDGKVARDADGEPIREELYGEEAQQVLADLPGLFMKLKEGHWRIYMKEGDDAQQQLVRDVELHDGRPAAGDAGTQDRPPTGESDVMEDATPMGDGANDDADDAGQDANADADNSNAALPVPENVPQGDGPVLEPARGRQAEHGTNANVTAAAGMGLATVTPRSAVQSLHVAVNRALRVVRSWSLLR